MARTDCGVTSQTLRPHQRLFAACSERRTLNLIRWVTGRRHRPVSSTIQLVVIENIDSAPVADARSAERGVRSGRTDPELGAPPLRAPRPRSGRTRWMPRPGRSLARWNGSTLNDVLVCSCRDVYHWSVRQFFASAELVAVHCGAGSMVISLTLVPVCGKVPCRAVRCLSPQDLPLRGHIYEGVWRWPCGSRGRNRSLYVGRCRGPSTLHRHPDWREPEKDQKNTPAPGSALQTGLLRGWMKEPFVLGLLRSHRHALRSPTGGAHKLEEILSANPDVESYVRRTGTDWGLCHDRIEATSRSFCPRRGHPVSLLTKPVAAVGEYRGRN